LALVGEGLSALLELLPRFDAQLNISNEIWPWALRHAS
jgi:hypothetical protein